MNLEHEKEYRMLGHNIRFYRNQRKLTQEALGAAIGTDKQQIGRIERAETGVTLDRIFDIAKALGLKDMRVLFDFRAMLDDE